MMKRLFMFLLTISVILVTGCVKDTYDMNKLSGKGRFSPTFALAALKGSVSFSDLVKGGDTIVFDENKFVSLIYRKDSVINLNLKDYLKLDDMVSFTRSYTLGVLSLGSFRGSLSVTLDQITQAMPAALRNQIRDLDDGVAHEFPSFPSVDMGERTFTLFEGFENAVFHSGYLDITLTNNLSAPLTGISIDLFNSDDQSYIGTMAFPAIQPGQTQSSSIDLTDKWLTNSVTATIVLQGSEGTTTPVIISLDNSSIQVEASGRDLKIKSGRIMLPLQKISSLNKDTISFNPGSGIEIDEIGIADGELSYNLKSGVALDVSMSLTLPSVRTGNEILTHTINTTSGTQIDGSISFKNTIIDLGTNPLQPYNSIPLEYDIDVGSGNVMISYNSTDEVELDIKLSNPEFGYVKGYFGQHSETIEPDTLDLGIDEILSSLTGDFLISSPSIKLNYSNSFAIPLKVDFQVTGRRGDESVNLDPDPVVIASPQYPDHDISSSIVVDKSNSELPELISLPPGSIIFSGAATINPSGNSGLRDNYVYGDSRFLGSAEIEIPMEFRMSNLQFSDTLDNFLKQDEDSDNPIKPENFEKLQLDLTAGNGFPLGVAVRMSLFDGKTKTIRHTIDASSLLEPAPVDANGKANGIKETTTSLKLSKEFFDAVKSSDKIIVWFTLNTTSSGSTDVKIYSDYRIDFKAALIVKPEIIFN